MKALRRLLLVLLIIVVLCAMLSWWSGIWLRPLVERQLQQYLVPRATLTAPLQLRLWPFPSIKLQDFALLSDDGSSLMSVQEVTLTPDWKALLGGRVELNAIDIAGVDLTVTQLPDGAWNVMHWLREVERQDENSGIEGVPPIRRVSVENMTLRILSPSPATIKIPLFEAGPIMPETPGTIVSQLRLDLPDVAVAETAGEHDRALGVVVDMSSGFQWLPERIEFDALRTVFSGAPENEERWRRLHGELHAERVSSGFDGRVTIEGLNCNGVAMLTDGTVADGLKLNAGFAMLSGQASDWRVAAPFLHLDGRYQEKTLSMQWSAPALNLTVDGWQMADWSLVAKLVMSGTPLTLDAKGMLDGHFSDDTRTAAVEVLQGRFGVPDPSDQAQILAIDLTGDAHIDFAAGSGHGVLRGEMEQSRFDGQWTIDLRQRTPISVSMSVDRLDMDRYLPPSASDEEQEASIDPAVWRQWPVDAVIRVGKFHMHGFTSHEAMISLSQDEMAEP